MRHEQLTDDLQEQASLFAAGAMTESERKEYARHLEEDQCAVCLSEVNELQSAVSMLAFSTASRSPSPSVQQRLLEQARNVASGKPIRSRSLLRRFWVDLIASSAAIAAIVVAFAVTRANTELRGLIDVLNSRIAQLEVQLSQNRTDIATLTQLDFEDRKSTRLNSSHTVISYAVFSLKKKKKVSVKQVPKKLE